MLELLALTLVVAFAGYRMGRAVAQDEITEPFRKMLYRWTYEVPERVVEREFEEAKEDPDAHQKPPTKPRPERRYIYDLFTCPLCIGFWITLVIGLVASANLTDASWIQHLLLAVAATGVQAWMSLREMAE